MRLLKVCRMRAETPVDHFAINVALCRALGIEDVRDVAAVDLRIRPGQLPVITVTRNVPRQGCAGAVERVVRQFELAIQQRRVAGG